MVASPHTAGATLSAEEARRLTTRAKQHLRVFYETLLELYEGGAHLALGFHTWEAYWRAEFDTDPSYGYKLLRAARVTRAVGQLASDLPVPNEAQARELVPLLDDEAELVRVYREVCATFGVRLTAKNIRDRLAGTAAHLARDLTRPAEPKIPALELPNPSELGGIHEDVPGFVIGCGDVRDTAFRTEVLRGEKSRLRMDDPPFGVRLDPTWRDGLVQRHGTTYGPIANDDRWDWSATYDQDVVYVFADPDRADAIIDRFAACGYTRRARITLAKPQGFSLGHYESASELLLYFTRRGTTTPWYGGTGQNNLWIPADAERVRNRGHHGHPTPKPVWAYLRAIGNHTHLSDLVVDFFVGSGTALIAAAASGRRCAAIDSTPTGATSPVPAYSRSPTSTLNLFPNPQLLLARDGHELPASASLRLLETEPPDARAS